MAEINYWGIEQAIKTLLTGSPHLPAGTNVLVEEEVTFQEGYVVVIYLDRFDAPAEQQTLSAGTRLREVLTFSIWCFYFALDVQSALQNRGALSGKVKRALMSDPSLGGTVESSVIRGGEFQTLPSQEGFMIGAEVVLEADAIATT